MSIKDITSWAEEFEVGTRYGDHTLIIQIGTLLRIIGDAVSNYTRITSVNQDYLANQDV